MLLYHLGFLARLLDLGVLDLLLDLYRLLILGYLALPSAPEYLGRPFVLAVLSLRQNPDRLEAQCTPSDPDRLVTPCHPWVQADLHRLLRLEDLVSLEGLEGLVDPVHLLDLVLLGGPLRIGDLPHIHYDYKFPFVIVRVRSSPFYLLTGYQYLTFGSFHVG